MRSIHDRSPDHVRGALTTIATDTNRTLFFDFLPLNIGDVAGIKTKIHLYAVPYIENQHSMRLLVLEGVDGIVFVADSSDGAREANLEALRDLRDNLASSAATCATCRWCGSGTRATFRMLASPRSSRTN